MQYNIQMVDLVSQYNRIKPQVNEAIQEVIENAAFINGPAVKELQSNMQKKLGVKHVIPCGNGTDALQIALMALGLKPGDEVITSTFTFIATAEVIALMGLVPVLVDVDLEDYNLIPEEVEAKITPKTKAIIPVHLFGQAANMDKICSIAQKHNLKIVEDTAQAINCEYTFENGSKSYVGTIGDIGTTSFFPSKNLGCFGDGGALFTNDDQLAEIMRMIVNHGSKEKYYHEVVGVNSRLDTLQAAILKVKFQYIDEYCDNRRSSAEFYSKELTGIKGIITPKVNANSNHVFHQYTIRVLDGKRDKLKDFLAKSNIPSMIYYPVSLHKQKAFTHYHDGTSIPNAEVLEQEVLSLPMHTELSKEVLLYICDHIKSFFSK